MAIDSRPNEPMKWCMELTAEVRAERDELKKEVEHLKEIIADQERYVLVAESVMEFVRADDRYLNAKRRSDTKKDEIWRWWDGLTEIQRTQELLKSTGKVAGPYTDEFRDHLAHGGEDRGYVHIHVLTDAYKNLQSAVAQRSSALMKLRNKLSKSGLI